MRSAFLIIIFISFNLHAQESSSGAASVDVVRPLSIQSINPNLDFGDIILTGSQFTVSMQPLNGSEFLITGHPSRNVIITFSPITLDNTQWANMMGSAVGQIQFTPSIMREDELNIISGNSYQLSGSDGTLRIFLGGNINISANQPYGDYLGTFVVNVSY